MSKENHIYYTYLYLDPRKQGKYIYGNLSFECEPFYVGYGKKNRYLSHLSEARNTDKNSHKLNKIRKILDEGFEPIIIKYEENLELKYAKIQEIFLIEVIGRNVLNMGPLTNLTEGGTGSSGHIWTEESKQKLSKTIKGRKHSKEHVRKIAEAQMGKVGSNRGKKFSKEWCDNMSKSQKGCNGRKKTQEEKDKISLKINEFNNTVDGKRIRKEGGRKSGEKQKGKKIKPESIAKSIKTRRDNGNDKHSDATKEKNRQIANEYWNSPEGQKQKEKLKDKIPCNKGKKYYNNGIENKYFLEGKQPKGWELGSFKKV